MKSLLAIVCFLAGLAAGLLAFSIPGFKLSREANVVHLLSILTTLIVAFLLQHYLKARSDDRRIEKNLIIEQAKAVRTTFETLRAAFTDFYLKSDATPPRNPALLAHLRQLSNAVTIFEAVLSETRIQCSPEAVQRIRSHYVSCKRELTQGSPRQPFTLATYLAADAALHRASQDITMLIMRVNSA